MSTFIEQFGEKWKTPVIEPHIGDILKFPFQIKPNDFIHFANRELAVSGIHGLINALSNAKRAIDCQIDAIHKVLGIKKERSFPKRADIINELGLLAPRVIKRIVRMRNYLEHEFILPEQERIEDAVDTATLFIELTNRIFRTFWVEFYIGEEERQSSIVERKKNKIKFEFNPSKFIYEIIGYNNEGKCFSETISKDDKRYLAIHRLSILSDFDHRDLEDDKIIEDFFDRIKNIKT